MAGLNTFDVVEIAIVGEIAGQRTLNILHYSVLNPSTSLTYVPAMQALLLDYLNSATGPLLPILAAAAQNWTCVFVRGQRIWPTRDVAVVKTDGRPGQVAADAEAQNLASVITKQGALGNRHNIGAIHLAGLAEGRFDEGDVTAQQLTAMNAVGARLVTDLVVVADGTTARNVIFDRLQPAVFTPIIATTSQETVRVMRRRTKGVGK